MARVPKHVLESFSRIGFNEKPFMDWLDTEIEEAKDQIMFQTDEAQLRISQGRAQKLSELRTLIKTAPEMLRKA